MYIIGLNTIHKSYVRVSIDATGSIVKKIKRTAEGILSSHIFLYEAVVSNGVYQLSISQMLSEKQDTFTIYYWLAMWIKDGVSVPQESVCDYSMALLGAITRAFCNGMTIRNYVDSCIEILSCKKIIKHQTFMFCEDRHCAPYKINMSMEVLEKPQNISSQRIFCQV